MCVLKNGFFWLTSLLFLGACDSPQESFSTEELKFFQSKAEDPDREQILALSDRVYSGSDACFVDTKCQKLCHKIYSSDDQKNCKKLKAQQVYQIEKLYGVFLEKNPTSLENVNVFDLKVFFNVNPEPLFQFFKSLDLFSSKIFLNWIALNWQVAQVFQEEDDQLIFLRIFLNKLSDSPINSLKEPILKDRTFIELAWLKQNDSALLWLYDYFQKNQCAGLEEKELDSCVLAQYCLAGANFKKDVSTEFIEFNFIRDSVKREGDYTDFNSFLF